MMPSSRQLMRAPLVFRKTGALAMAQSLSHPASWRILEIRLHLNAAGGVAEDFTAKVDSSTAAVYDALLFSQDTNGLTDIFDVTPHHIATGDEVDFAWANAGGKTWGLEVFYEVLP